MTDFLIDVIVDPAKATPGMDKVDGRLQRLEKSGKRLQNTLRRAITLVGIVAAGRQLGVFADSLTNVQNRIRLVTRDTAQLNAVTKKLFDISARTRTGFAATATIFSRTALAVKDLGLSLQETLDFTEALNQAIVLSGVKAQEANAGLIQLSQGLASGTLRGDELRSVLEQLPKVADLIAGELGVLRGELRILGEQGKITTADIIKAFTGIAAADLSKAFAESVPTMSQGFSVLTTRIIEYVGQVDAAQGISTAIAKTLITLSANLENIGKAAVVAGAALVGPFAKQGVLFATRAVQALTLAIIANPIGAIVVGTLAAAAAIWQFGDSLAVSEDGLVSLKDVAIATWDFIVAGIEPLVAIIAEGFKFAINFVISSFGALNITLSDVVAHAKLSVGNIIGFFFGMAGALKSVAKDLKAIFSDVLGEDVKKFAEATLNFINDGLDTLALVAQTIRTELGLIAKDLGLITGEAFTKGFGEGKGLLDDLVVAAAPALKKISDDARRISATRQAQPVGGAAGDEGIGDKGVKKEVLPFALRNMLRLLAEEGKLLQQNNRERGVQKELLELEEKLRSSNVTLNDKTRALLETEVRRLTGLREQADVLDDLRGPQDDIISRQTSLNALYSKGSISLREFTAEMHELALAQAELNIDQGDGSFADGFMLGIDSMLEGIGNFTAQAGELFGDFFASLSEGFGNAIGNAIVFGDSVKDAIGGAARSAVAQLLSGLISVGIQFVLNKVLSQTAAQADVAGTAVSATAETTAMGVKTAAALASMATVTAAVLASNVAIATSAAAPAALVSLASYGANSAPASAGITATAAIAQGVAATAFLAEGGYVTGPGTTTSDSIPAMLSDKEFVVNAKSTARFRPQLEAINNGGGKEIFDNSSSGESQSGTSNSESGGGGGVNVINVLDPGIVEDFLDSPNGEKTILNVIERNAAGIGQIVGGR